MSALEGILDAVSSRYVQGEILTVAVSENIWFVHGLEIEDLNNLAVVEL
jgi:hypothetical protein